MEDFDLTVIGGGADGLVVASGAVQLGARVTLRCHPHKRPK